MASSQIAAMNTVDITTIRDEDLLRKMWHDAQDFGRKREIRAHMYKLREERLKSLYAQVEQPIAPSFGFIMDHSNTSTKYGLSKNAVTGSHGDSLADQSFESFKTKEIRDSESPTRFGTVIPSDNSGWHVTTSEELSTDGKTHTVRSSATTEGTKEVDGGRSSFAGKNEEARSERFEGDDKNFVHSKGDQSSTFLAENTSIEGDDGRKIEKKSTSVTSSSSRVVRSHQMTGDDTDFAPIKLGHDTKLSELIDSSRTSTKTREERLTHLQEIDGNTASKQLSKDPERVSEAFRLINEPGQVISRDESMINASTKMITVTKLLDDGTKVTTRNYEKIGLSEPPGVDSAASSKFTRAQQEAEDLCFQQVTDRTRKTRSDLNKHVGRDETEHRTIKKDVSDKVTNLRFVTEERADSQRHEQSKRQQQEATLHEEELGKQHEREEQVRKHQQHEITTQHEEQVRMQQQQEITTQREEQIRKQKQQESTIQREEQIKREEQTKKQQENTTQRRITVDVDAAHDSFARSLRCVSPTGSVRSVRSNSTTGRSSVSPDKSTRGRRSPSRESDVSHFSTHTTTRSSRTDVSSSKDYMRPTITSERKHSNFKETTIEETSTLEDYDTVDKTKLKERSASPKKVPQNTPDMTPRGPSPDKLSRHASPSKTPKESSPFCSVTNSRAASPVKRDTSPTKSTPAKLVREDALESYNVDTTITISTKERLQQQVREDVEVFDTQKDVTDLDDITINVKLENVNDDIEVTTTVEEVDLSETKPVEKDEPAPKKAPKKKPPLVRSETFEERCRKILGMPGQVEETEEDNTPSIFSTYDNTLTRSSEVREKRKKIEQEVKTIESTTLKTSRETNDFIESERRQGAKHVSPSRRPSQPMKETSPSRKASMPAKESSPSKSTSPIRKHSQPSPERRPQQQPKDTSPVRKHSQPSPERRAKEVAPQSKETSPVRKYTQPSVDHRPKDKSPVPKQTTVSKDTSPARKYSHPSPERQPKEQSPIRQPSPAKEDAPSRCSRSHERSPVPTEKSPSRKPSMPQEKSPIRKTPSAASPTRKPSRDTSQTDSTVTRTTTISKANILVNQKNEGKNMSVTEITIHPVVETKKSDKVLTKQTSDSKFERRTTNSRVVTNKSSSDLDIKRKAISDRSETVVDRTTRITSKPRTPATSPDKRRQQDTSPTKFDKPKNHITVAKIKIEPVRKPILAKIVVDDRSTKPARTSRTAKKIVEDYTEPESDKDTGISDNEVDDETVTTVETTTTTVTTTKKHPISDRKDSAPVYRTTGKADKSYTRSSSDNVLKSNNVSTTKKTQSKLTTATNTTSSTAKKIDRPVKCVTTKTINLSTKPMIVTDNLDNVVIDIQQAKSSREPTPNKLIPIPVSPDEDTGMPRYPDAVQEPDDEPKQAPKVSNIPIFEEATNEYVGCEITEVEDHEVRAARASRITNLDRVTEDDESLLSVTQKVSRFVEEANRLKDVVAKTPNRFVRCEYDELDEHLKSDECLLSVSDKVTKFISTAEEVKKIKTSGPFVPDCKVTVDVTESDESSVNVNSKTSKHTTADATTTMNVKLVKTTTDEMDRSLVDENDESLLSVLEKKKKFITAPNAPQRSPELVKNIMKQTTRHDRTGEEGDSGLESDQKTSIVDRYTTATLTKPRDKVPQSVALRSTEAVKKAKSIFENGNKAAASETARQKDILSRPSIWEDRRKKEQSTTKVQTKSTQEKSLKDVKLTDIGVVKKTQPKVEPEPNKEETVEPKQEAPKARRDSGTPKTPAYIRDTVSTKKDLFEKRISSSKLETADLVKSITSEEEKVEYASSVKRPSITEKYERSISRETPTPGNKPSYMNHTVSSLEHMTSSRRESVDNTQRTSIVEELLEQQETTAKLTNKFGVELKRTDSGRNVLTSPVKRKSSAEVPHIEEIFELELLEKMLETVTGYEQRRRIRSKIRVVKKMGEKPSATTTSMTTATMRTNSRVRDVSPKRKETSPTRGTRKASQDTESKFTKTVTSENKYESSQRSASPTKPKPMMNGRGATTTTTVTSTTKTSKFGEKIPPKDLNTTEPKEHKPIWATSNILKKASETTRTYKTSSITNSAKKTTAPMRDVPKEVATDCITSSYGVGPTDENGLPLFGIRALKKKAAPAPDMEMSSKITGSIVTETLYSENGAAPVGERKTTLYSSNPKDFDEFNISDSKRNLAEVREKLLERENSRKGLIAVTKTEKISNGSSHVTTEIGTLEDVPQREAKVVRKGSVKELTERFVHKESSSSLMSEKTYPKAGLILRSTQSQSSRSSTPCDISSVRSGSVDFDENDIELRSVTSKSALRENIMTSSSTASFMASAMSEANQEEVEDGVVFRKSHSSSTRQTRSFLNDGSRVSGVQDVLDRMRNADNVEETGDSTEDREARALLNKFLGASVLMSGMESMVASSSKEESSSTAEGSGTPGSKKVSKVTTTRTVKSTASSSSNNAPKPSIENLEQIWDEAVLKQLLDSSTSYEERRKIRARLRQIMAEKEACADIVASVTADLQRERQLQQQQSNDSNNNSSSIQEVTSTSTSKVQSQDGGVLTTRTTVTTKSVGPAKPMSAMAKFRQLDKQHSITSQSPPNSPRTPSTPSTPGAAGSMFTFTDPSLNRRAATVKDQLLQWCQMKTREYENVKIENFSTAWSDGMAFCALIHHFLPDAFDFTKLTPQQRRHNFTLAFRVADEKAGIAPLLDVEDMVVMRKPDWKCVFTYVQSIYRRFKNED